MSRFDGRRFGFAACGDDVTIYEWVRVLAPEHIEIGNRVIVDDFVFLDGKGGLQIGSHVHIASYVSVVGGGRCSIGDFAGLSSGVRIVTGTDLVEGGLTGPTVPDDLRSVRRGAVSVGRHALIFTNSVVHPDVVIGEGAVVGSGSVVTRDVAPWTIVLGSPARPVRERRRDETLAMERALEERER